MENRTSEEIELRQPGAKPSCLNGLLIAFRNNRGFH
jgi:hypothetical protein